MLIRPPTNHSACGGSHFKTESHFLNQCNSPSAILAQKLSGDSLASRLRASNSSADTLARAANSSGGGKTLSSCSTDSMFDVEEDINPSEDLSPLIPPPFVWLVRLVYQNPPPAARPTHPTHKQQPRIAL